MVTTTAPRAAVFAGAALAWACAGLATPAAADMFARVVVTPAFYGYAYPYPYYPWAGYSYYPYYVPPPLIAYPDKPPPGFVAGHWEQGRDQWGRPVSIWIPAHLQ